LENRKRSPRKLVIFIHEVIDDVFAKSLELQVQAEPLLLLFKVLLVDDGLNINPKVLSAFYLNLNKLQGKKPMGHSAP
jgi:hypothetical protein